MGSATWASISKGCGAALRGPPVAVALIWSPGGAPPYVSAMAPRAVTVGGRAVPLPGRRVWSMAMLRCGASGTQRRSDSIRARERAGRRGRLSLTGSA